MTKKNARKDAARARQDRLGGRYLHHKHVVSDRSEERERRAPSPLAMSIDQVVALAARTAPAALREAGDRFGNARVVYVVVDGAHPVGERIAALRIAEVESIEPQAALDGVRREVARRGARRENAPFAELMTHADLDRILEACYEPFRHAEMRAFTAQFSRTPPPDHVPILAVAEGGMRRTVVPSVPTCVCGHAIATHDRNGACTWVGVPERGSVFTLPQELVAEARGLGVPVRCACLGYVVVDAEGRVVQ